MPSDAKERPALDERYVAYLLSHPLRARIVAELRERPWTPGQLAELLQQPRRRIAYHYGVLRAARAI